MPTLTPAPRSPDHPPAPGNAQFLELLMRDDELVAEMFEQIISAEWPTPPGGSGTGRTSAPTAPEGEQPQGIRDGGSAGRSSRAPRVNPVAGNRTGRVRSPPRRPLTHLPIDVKQTERGDL